MTIDDAAVRRFAAEYTEGPRPPLCVVIAAYNEERGIADVVCRVPATVCGLATETIVVVDGATDATAERARRAGARVCDVPRNRGQGAALRLGYRLARKGGAEYIATLDADGQYDPAELGLVVEPLVSGRADFVTGSRRLGRSESTDRTREAGVVVFAALISVLARRRITDPANGLRAMRAEVTASVPLEQPQYQASELLLGALLRGYRVVEVPTTVHLRTAGVTKKGRNLAYGVRFAGVIFGTWRRDRSRSPKMTNS